MSFETIKIWKTWWLKQPLRQGEADLAWCHWCHARSGRCRCLGFIRLIRLLALPVRIGLIQISQVANMSEI